MLRSLFVLVLLCSPALSQAPRRIPAPRAPRPAPAPAFNSVRAADLWLTYQKNAIAADKAHTDKKIIVSISSFTQEVRIKKNTDDDGYGLFVADLVPPGKNVIITVFFIDKKDAEGFVNFQAGYLQAGDELVIEGVCIGCSDGTVVFNHCIAKKVKLSKKIDPTEALFKSIRK
jgi:hypothetical protein